MGKCNVFIRNSLQEKCRAFGRSRRRQKKMMSFLSSIAEKRLEEWILGYQQVIHNAKLPTAVIVRVVVAPACGKKEALYLYKYL